MQRPDHKTACASVKSDIEMAKKFFSEYFECYADWDYTSGIILLKEDPLPQGMTLEWGRGGTPLWVG